MELQQINQRIAVVNAESKRLNNERQLLIGKHQTLKKQLDDLLQAYEKNYGVTLTSSMIDDEISRVVAQKESELSNIETMLALIKEGRYDEAEQLAVGELVSEVEHTPAAQSEPAPAAPPVAPPVFEKPVVEMPTATMQTPVATMQTPVAPIAPVAPVTPPPVNDVPASPVQTPVATVQTPVATMQTPVAPVTPPPVSDIPAPPPPMPNKAPKIGAPPAMGQPASNGMSFQAILSGSAFNPQGV